MLDLADMHGWQADRYAPILAPRRLGDSYRVFCDREDQRAANFANNLSGLAIVNRILISIRPSMQWLESKNQAHALDIQYMHSF